jgi:hypothetical protein
MTQDEVDLIVKIILAIFWAGTLGLVIFMFLKMQKQAAKDMENQIKLKDEQIKESVDASSLDNIVALNNDERSKGGH